MATEEKLLKSLEYLKHASNSDISKDILQRNKEKVSNCLYISNTITCSTIKVLPNFNQLLSSTFEILLQLCSDSESDVRLTAEESLNKIIKAMDNENINKILIELHKEIKKNGYPKSLKAALWRFSCLADLIRLAKRKQYLISLIPCIISISERSEELVHETLMNGLPKILKSLGNFLSDSDVKILLNAFLKNLSNSSPVIRRTAVNCLLVICTSCRKSYNFLIFLLDILLDLLVTVDSISEFLVLGILNCLKILIPYIKNIENKQEIQGSFGITKKMDEIQVNVDKLVQVYDICLHFLLCSNETIMGASLETLNSLLQNHTPEFKAILLASNGIDNNRLQLPSRLHTSSIAQRESTSTSKQTTESYSSMDICNQQVSVEENVKYKCITEDINVNDVAISDNCNIDKVFIIADNSESTNIGDFKDKEIPLIYCTRVICKLFLLSGESDGIISDTNVRISMKNLALTCLSSIFEIYPEGFLLHLNKEYLKGNDKEDITNQVVSDIMLLGNHSDPQLRGVVRIVIAFFIKAVLIESGGCYNNWLFRMKNKCDTLHLENLIQLIMKGLQDSSSSCIRQSLTSLNICLKHVLNSQECDLIIPILKLLPSMANNSHWLVKAKLLDIITELPFLIIHSMTGSEEFQNKIVFNVLPCLLEDEDQRIRSIASSTIVKIVPFLYFEQQRTVEEVTIERTHMYFYNLSVRDDETRKIFADIVPFPYNTLNDLENINIKIALSRIISKLHQFVLTKTTDKLIHGLVETLSLLSLSYPSVIYKESWNSFKTYDFDCERTFFTRSNSSITTPLKKHNITINSSAGLLNVINCLFDHEIVYDINCHIHVLQLFGNLFAGICIENIQLTELNAVTQKSLWNMFSSKHLQEVSESFLNHIVKLLNIFVHIIEEIQLEEHKPAPSNLPASSNVSPLKAKKNEVENIEKSSEEEDNDKKGEPPKVTEMGHFTNSSHYMKIFDVLKVAYTNYKVTLNTNSSENIIKFLCMVLKSLCQILEITTIAESSRIVEEILHYLQITFYLEPTTTVLCVYQLLKSLFGTNLLLNEDVYKLPDKTIDKVKNTSLYHSLSHYPYNDMSYYIKSFKQTQKFFWSEDNFGLGYFHRKEKKLAFVKSDKILASYIKLFEPMVIKSLKHYTTTSNVELQCAVLQLLNQLVQLKVNYCLLDSEQVFIKFIQKQFEFIEEGLTAHPEELIPKIFYFLMNLSHGRQHSKSIISVPKVIHLCDGLMASGQAPLTYCIPALKPIVEDLFLVRNKSNTVDFKELEITREVLLSMLLRLFEYAAITDLLVIILNKCKDTSNVEKSLKWSKQIYDVFVNKLMYNKLKLDNGQNMISLMKLLTVLHPTVFKSTNELLITLFQKFPKKVDSLTTISRWLGKVIIILIVVLQLKEEILLLNINASLKDFSPECIFDEISVKSDPLNVIDTRSYFEGLTSDIILIKFIFRTLDLISSKCLVVITDKENYFLVEQLSHFLLICQYFYQLGNHSVITNTTIRLVQKDSPSEHKIILDTLNQNFLNISTMFPSLLYQWSSILVAINLNSRRLWSAILGVRENYRSTSYTTELSVHSNERCLFLKISKAAAILTFSEYLIENKDDLLWFLENNIESLIWLCEEPFVADLTSSIHKDSLTSSQFIESILSKCFKCAESSFVIKLLHVLQNSHNTQITPLLQILVKKLLNCRHLALSRMAVNLTCRKLEYLLTLSVDEIQTHMPKEELLKIINYIVDKKAKRNEAIVNLLNKLFSQAYNCSPLDQDRQKFVNTKYIKNLKINKEWYLNQLTARDYLYYKNVKILEILSQLDCDDIMTILSNKYSKKVVLRNVLHYRGEYCLKNENLFFIVFLEVALKDIVTFLNIFPKLHQVYIPIGRQETVLECTYSQQLHNLFKDNSVWETFEDLIPVVESCAIYFTEINSQTKLEKNNFSVVVKFCVISLESITHLLTLKKQKPHIDYIEKILVCVNTIFKVPELIHLLTLDVHLTWLCSSINSIYKLISFLLLNYEPFPDLPTFFLKSLVHDPSITIAKHACYQLAVVFTIIERYQHLIVNIPDILYSTIKSIAISFSKLPIVNSYLLTPMKVWKNNNWVIECTGPFLTEVPPLPVDFLKDNDVLEEFVFRISNLGWSNRQQFEEMWMCLLSILNSSLINENESGHSTSFAIKAITALLVQTLYESTPGNANNPKLLHVSRDPVIPGMHSRIKELKYIQDKFEEKFKEEINFLKDSIAVINVFGKPNIEKYTQSYACGQLSIAYLLFSSKTVEVIDENNYVAKLYEKQQTILEEFGLDLNSCIQSLLDLYTQWIKVQFPPSLKICNEILKSVLIISDLFQEKSQFSWMLDICIDLSRNHLFENEIFHQYLTIGICKAAAIINPDMETYELIKKILSQNSKSLYLSVRTSCLQGLLYILEGCVLTNTVIGGISEELQLLLPVITEYIDFHNDPTITILHQFQDHNLAMWAITFYIIENISEDHLPSGFVTSAINTVISILKVKKQQTNVYSSLMKGLERLVITKSLSSELCEQITKLALHKTKDSNAINSLLGIQLLITCMYTGCISKQSDADYLNDNPDNLIQVVEKLSVIFDRIRRGIPFEVKILCHILPNIINDFFTPSDILTKVVGEFLSPQQKHPQLFSQVVFQVFESGITQSQLTLLQDWVVVSLSNFTQTFSIGMATWYLTCFFISTSTNFWLRSIFSYVQSRIGRFEHEDKEIFCIAGRDFYSNLTTEKQRQIFVDTFQKVKDQTDMPFRDLLECL